MYDIDHERESRLIAARQDYAGLAIAGADFPDQAGAEVVAVFGLRDPRAQGGIFRDDGSFTSWDRPIVAYSLEMLNAISFSADAHIGGDKMIATRAMADLAAAKQDSATMAALPKAVDVATDHKLALERAHATAPRGFGKKPAPGDSFKHG